MNSVIATYHVRPGIMALAAILESMVRDHEKDIGAPEGKDDAGWLCERLREEAIKDIKHVTEEMRAEGAGNLARAGAGRPVPVAPSLGPSAEPRGQFTPIYHAPQCMIPNPIPTMTIDKAIATIGATYKIAKSWWDFIYATDAGWRKARQWKIALAVIRIALAKPTVQIDPHANFSIPGKVK